MNSITQLLPVLRFIINIIIHPILHTFMAWSIIQHRHNPVFIIIWLRDLAKGESSDSFCIFGDHINILKHNGTNCWDIKNLCNLLGSVIWFHLILTINDNCFSKRPYRYKVSNMYNIQSEQNFVILSSIIQLVNYMFRPIYLAIVKLYLV